MRGFLIATYCHVWLPEGNSSDFIIPQIYDGSHFHFAHLPTEKPKSPPEPGHQALPSGGKAQAVGQDFIDKPSNLHLDVITNLKTTWAKNKGKSNSHPVTKSDVRSLFDAFSFRFRGAGWEIYIYIIQYSSTVRLPSGSLIRRWRNEWMREDLS